MVLAKEHPTPSPTPDNSPLLYRRFQEKFAPDGVMNIPREDLLKGKMMHAALRQLSGVVESCFGRFAMVDFNTERLLQENRLVGERYFADIFHQVLSGKLDDPESQRVTLLPMGGLYGASLLVDIPAPTPEGGRRQYLLAGDDVVSEVVMVIDIFQVPVYLKAGRTSIPYEVRRTPFSVVEMCIFRDEEIDLEPLVRAHQGGIAVERSVHEPTGTTSVTSPIIEEGFVGRQVFISREGDKNSYADLSVSKLVNEATITRILANTTFLEKNSGEGVKWERPPTIVNRWTYSTKTGQVTAEFAKIDFFAEQIEQRKPDESVRLYDNLPQTFQRFPLESSYGFSVTAQLARPGSRKNEGVPTLAEEQQHFADLPPVVEYVFYEGEFISVDECEHHYHPLEENGWEGIVFSPLPKVFPEDPQEYLGIHYWIDSLEVQDAEVSVIDEKERSAMIRELYAMELDPDV